MRRVSFGSPSGERMRWEGAEKERERTGEEWEEDEPVAEDMNSQHALVYRSKRSLRQPILDLSSSDVPRNLRSLISPRKISRAREGERTHVVETNDGPSSLLVDDFLRLLEGVDVLPARR